MRLVTLTATREMPEPPRREAEGKALWGRVAKPQGVRRRRGGAYRSRVRPPNSSLSPCRQTCEQGVQTAERFRQMQPMLTGATPWLSHGKPGSMRAGALRKWMEGDIRGVKKCETIQRLPRIARRLPHTQAEHSLDPMY
eukprot:6488841-Amphidinium_carterae.2